MDMSKYKPLFLSETAEHFDAMEAELIALDEHGGDIGHINEVFRHLHSIKSMSASMGYAPFSGLAHRLESMVASHQKSAIAIRSDEIDILLRGLDELRQMLQSARADKPIPAISSKLSEELDRQEQHDRSLESGSSMRMQGPGTRMANASPSWTIRIGLSPDCSMPGVRAFMALHKLRHMGMIESSDPTEEDLRSGKLPEGQLTVMLSTNKSEADLRQSLDSIYHISQVDIRPSEARHLLRDKVQLQRTDHVPIPVQQQTVRVRTELLDFFVNSVGELITLRSFFEDISSQQDIPALADGVRRMGTIIRKLQERVMEVRMVSVSALTVQLPRVCRDLARRRSKKVSLKIQGTEVELDRALVQTLSNPLLHMLRNAVEHGIEPPIQRKENGKPETGLISISFKRSHDRVLMEINDDGAGIDENKLAAKAVSMGIINTPDKAPENRLDLIFQPGLSSKDEVNEVSGRGVGMDVVKETIQQMGGQIRVKSNPGKGTTFITDLPFTLAIIQILLIETQGHLLALPAARVKKAIPMDPARVSDENGRKTLRTGGKQYQYLSLSDILGIETDKGEPDTEQEVILLGNESGQSLAIGVARLTGHREAVLKAIGGILRRAGPFSSSTVLGDGNPVLILDVDELMRRASPSGVHNG